MTSGVDKRFEVAQFKSSILSLIGVSWVCAEVGSGPHCRKCFFCGVIGVLWHEPYERGCVYLIWAARI